MPNEISEIRSLLRSGTLKEIGGGRKSYSGRPADDRSPGRRVRSNLPHLGLHVSGNSLRDRNASPAFNDGHPASVRGRRPVCVDTPAGNARAKAARVAAPGADWSSAVSRRTRKPRVGRATRAFGDRGAAGGNPADVDRGACPHQGHGTQVRRARIEWTGVGIRRRRRFVWPGSSCSTAEK